MDFDAADAANLIRNGMFDNTVSNRVKIAAYHAELLMQKLLPRLNMRWGMCLVSVAA